MLRLYSPLVMFATRRVLLCLLVIYLLAQPIHSSWLKKTYKKLENSTKKRIAEGIAIAIKGGSRRRRFIADLQIGPRANVDHSYDAEFVQN
ncbi:unnamed protein product [Toxocara canis]|uniref:Cecropin-P2 n=1 Tax=Toxocara canis TaxID=6265 RepID=A0A3P7EWZ4_TOXCA|nr:unnamed protein product [Toxocara canis]